MWQNAFVTRYNHLNRPFKSKTFNHAKDFDPIIVEKNTKTLRKISIRKMKKKSQKE